MFQEVIIDLLSQKICFDKTEAIPTLDPALTCSAGSRPTKFFHALATSVNLFFTLEKELTTEINFNLELLNIRRNSTISVLNSVLKQNDQYDPEVDMTKTIINHEENFAEIIGYKTASIMLNIMLSTTRKNVEERNASLRYEKLKIEVSGFINERGFLQTPGLNQLVEQKQDELERLIYPLVPIVIAEPYW